MNDEQHVEPVADTTSPEGWAALVAQEELEERRTRRRQWTVGVFAAFTILVAVVGLVWNGQALRDTVHGQSAQIESLTVAVEQLTDVSAGQRGTIARLERRLDEAEAVATCRSRINSNTMVALIRILRVVTGNALGRPAPTPEDLQAIDKQLADAQAERETTDQICDPGEAS